MNVYLFVSKICMMADRHNSERLIVFSDRQTDRQTNKHNISDFRVAFATESYYTFWKLSKYLLMKYRKDKNEHLGPD